MFLVLCLIKAIFALFRLHLSLEMTVTGEACQPAVFTHVCLARCFVICWWIHMILQVNSGWCWVGLVSHSMPPAHSVLSVYMVFCCICVIGRGGFCGMSLPKPGHKEYISAACCYCDFEGDPKTPSIPLYWTDCTSLHYNWVVPSCHPLTAMRFYYYK